MKNTTGAKLIIKRKDVKMFNDYKRTYGVTDEKIKLGRECMLRVRVKNPMTGRNRLQWLKVTPVNGETNQNVVSMSHGMIHFHYDGKFGYSGIGYFFKNAKAL
jgi:hypothetical protein